MSFTVAIVGRPNVGKSTLFNTLTGLHQKTGNFPGVTVDKKTGTILFQDNYSATLIDLPGTYSLKLEWRLRWVNRRQDLLCADRLVRG